MDHQMRYARMANRYLNLLESALVGSLYGDPPNDTWSGGRYNALTRMLGRDWPSLAHSMIGTVKDTLYSAPIDKIAVLRLDGDMYESTIQALDALYFKVSRGGYVIVDDYILTPCAQAIHEFRNKYSITSPLLQVDGTAAWWQVDHPPLTRSADGFV